MRTLVYLGLVVAILTGCAANPLTGRQQLKLVSNDQVMKMSRETYLAHNEKARKEGRLEMGTPRAQRVKEITDRLIQQARVLRPESSSWAWEVKVIRSEELNAFCMPGGRMAIYTGLIEKLNMTDDEIAIVMGHEISHALLEHSAEKISHAVLGSAVAEGVAAYAANRNPQVSPAAGQLAILGYKIFLQLPNSRTTELESDKLGMRIAAQAGYDPSAAITFFEKMSVVAGHSVIPEFLRTHPLDPTRGEQAYSVAPILLSEYPDAIRKPSEVRRQSDYDQPVGVAESEIPKEAKYSYQAEKFGESQGCLGAVTFVEKGPGFETYTVSCKAENVLTVRCEYGQCTDSISR